WKDMFEFLKSIDTILLGAGMYAEYADYWRRALSDPKARPDEVKYSKLAGKIEHIVFSNSLTKIDPKAPDDYNGEWRKNTRIVKGDVKTEVLKLKKSSGKDIVLWGGASMASSFIEMGLIDEYRLSVNQIILGGGKSLFQKGTKHALKLIGSKTYKSGVVLLRYKPSK
ncbi:MAG TPA: dihydrofolate reductase family protein, partial [Chryseolinea sp.]|nr:dihydrofolate reductase family protein [Chryseolinea sp.]